MTKYMQTKFKYKTMNIKSIKSDNFTKIEINSLKDVKAWLEKNHS